MGSTDTVDLKLEKIMELVGDKWSARILFYLFENSPARYSECQKAKKINTKTLVKRLTTLEKAGLIDKKEFNEYPPRTEYSITAKGKQLIPAFKIMAEWAEKNLT
jgi:DNA-binding HxlR family transcriptional regulator